MKLQQFEQNFTFHHQSSAQYELLTLQQISETSPQQILAIILEKDQTIKAFSQQITKFKAEQQKTKKLISSLQEKIEKTSLSTNNTSNSFMIASQFKALFTAFMTSTVPSVFYDFTEEPKIYSALLKTILEGAYQKIKQILCKKTKDLHNVLFSNQKESQNLDETQNERIQIASHLLNFLQKYFKQIFPTQIDQNIFQIKILESTDLSEDILEKIHALNSHQTQKSDEIKQFASDLYQICIYMILQEQPWEFVFNQEPKSSQNLSARHVFSKKQFTCIDGFAKQGAEVTMVLKSLRRKQNFSKDFHYHPNIKNFVLPSNQIEQTLRDSKFEAKILFLNFKEKTPQIPQLQQKYLKNINLPNIQIQTVLENLQTNPNKTISEESLRIQSVSQTEKSQLIKQSLTHKHSPIIKNDSNCIIELTESYTLKRKNSHKQKIGYFHEDKENYNENIGFTKPDKKMSIKKEKSLLDKNISKKNKKQKNNSTIDLTTQKHKASFKEGPKQNLQNENVKKKHDEAILTREIPKSSKKKVVNKSSRKCSVGKIVSQSTQMTGSNIHCKDKISFSQHNTVVMKQILANKPLKDNYFQEICQGTATQNKQNLGVYVDHMYQKQILRPKKSTKLSKNQEKPLIMGEKKQERPLAMRAYQNGCLVGKLREKYLVS